MKVIDYDRDAAVAYARQWAFRRNPAYYNFQNIGGDCTNFASQCLFAGVGVMNYTMDLGWYYQSPTNRAAAWTGVEYFFNFLIGNLDGVGDGAGPFAEEVDLSQIQIGDFIQFGRATGDFYHTPIVVGFSQGVPLLAAHTYDAYNRPLTSYRYEKLRGIHILGARTP
jgi:hypothetical protein